MHELIKVATDIGAANQLTQKHKQGDCQQHIVDPDPPQLQLCADQGGRPALNEQQKRHGGQGQGEGNGKANPDKYDQQRQQPQSNVIPLHIRPLFVVGYCLGWA